MASTYNPSLVEPKDYIRFIIGDTSTGSDALVPDEAIEGVLSRKANVYMAAASIVRSIALKQMKGGFEDRKVGETRIRLKRANDLLAFANHLATEGRDHQIPFAGGIFNADSDSLDTDTTMKQPSFDKGMHDSPLAPPLADTTTG